MLSRLLAVRGPSGFEGEVRALIREEAWKYADEVTTDALGNLIALRRGTDERAPHVMLDAHMDEVGLIVQSIDSDGLVRYGTLGGIDPVVMPSKRVLIGKNAVPGVVGAKPIHLQEPGERGKPFTHKGLRIDIGASSESAAAALIGIGDFITFDSDEVRFGDERIKSRALDDRVGCFILLKLMQQRYPSTVSYVFSVQEEVGLRGATVAARRVNPDIAIVVESTTAADFGDAQEHEEVCNLGGGPTISFMDTYTIAHYPLMLALRAVADAHAIPWQVKRSTSGGNNAGAIHRALGGIRTAAVSVPCRYIHSPASVASLRDIDNTYALLEAYLQAGAQVQEVDR